MSTPTIKTLFLIVSLSILINGTYSTDINSSPRKSEIFNKVLEGSYDTKIRAPGPDNKGPVCVSLSIYVRSIENIDDVNMEYTVQLTFRQQWIDPRVNYEDMEKNVEYLQLVKPERIWRPDVFFSNEKSSSLHQLMQENVFTRIYPNGLVLQSYRITLKLSCPMNLRYYPLDSQLCPIRMASYGWTTKDVTLTWRSYAAIHIADHFNMPQFQLNGHTTGTCESYTSAGNYSCIEMHFEFERRFGFYLIQIYVPCIMLVVVSWVSFWLGPTAVEARISLGVTTILTIVTQTYGINQSVPPASYVKAIDVWTAVCQFMVFAAVLQFSYVNYLARMQWKKGLKDETEAVEDVMRKLGEIKAKRADLLSKFLFPIVFALFNIAYWTAYSGSSAIVGH